MIYRIAKVNDFETLAELRWEMRGEGGETPKMKREEFVAKCAGYFADASKSGFQTFFVAEENGRIVGNLSVHKIELVPRPSRFEDSFGYLTNNYVIPEVRGNGVGAELLSHVRVWALEQDFELLTVYLSEKAVPLYERSGYSAENEVLELKLRDY